MRLALVVKNAHANLIDRQEFMTGGLESERSPDRAGRQEHGDRSAGVVGRRSISSRDAAEPAAAGADRLQRATAAGRYGTRSARSRPRAAFIRREIRPCA